MFVVRWSSLVAVAALVTVSLARPQPCAAQMASARNVTLRMTVPDGVTKIKGVLAFTTRGLASGWAGNAAFKDLAKRLDSAIVMVAGGDDLNDNSYPNRCASGEFNGLGEALEKLGMVSNHPELAHAPVIGMGHSHGGDWWNWYNACHPERMVAVMVHASGGVNYSAGALKTPVFYTLGTGDLIENGSKKPRAGMFVNRGKGAPMTMVISAGGHDTQFPPEEYQIVTAILEAIFKMRVPPDADGAKGPIKLFDIVEGEGTWVGDLYTKEISPYSTFKGNKALTSFLPNEQLAMMWKTNGPALPTSIMLPTGSCSWCGTPKDEPKADGTNPAPPPADGGATPPAPEPDTGATTTPPVVTADAGASAPAPAKKDASAPVTTPPTDEPEPEPTPTAPRSSGGCSVAAGSSAGAPLLLLLAIYGLRRRRR
jgi:MYXO-CTERM domain-containing protein